MQSGRARRGRWRGGNERCADAGPEGPSCLRRGEGAFDEAQPSVSEPKTLTRRSRRKQKRKSTVKRYQRLTVTLGHLDVRHGNLRVNRRLRALLPKDTKTVQFADETGRSFVAHLDDTGGLLDLRGWLAERGLTYGDKVLIQATAEAEVLHIYPKGERDEQVYQEAIQRQDIERLIEQARQTKKSYHDLMIEVMEFIGAPLHREDIYQLVDYHRTASRAHVFALLSLPGCPYEELRYFVPHGHGYWSFDRQRKEAFDMKMRALEAEIKDLRAENARLQERLRKQREHLTSVERERNAATAEVKRLADQMANHQAIVAKLHATLDEQTCRVEDLEQQNEVLRAELATTRREAEAQRSEVAALWAERETRRTQVAALREQNEQLLKASQTQSERVQTLTVENETLRAELSRMQEQVNQAQANQAQLERRVTTRQAENEALRAELESLREQAGRAQTLEQTIIAAQTEIRTLRTELSRLQEKAMVALEERSQLQQRVDALQQANTSQVEEIARLSTRLERVRQALRSPLGRVFVSLMRLMGGNNFLDL